jgi:hypothetical protein
MTATELERLCNDYARRMATEPLLFRERVEWDFPEVAEVELPFAVEYEYARQSTAVRQQAVETMSKRIGRRTIRTILLEEDDIPEQALEALLSSKIGGLLLNYPLFPMPWLAFERSDRVETSADLSRFKVPVVSGAKITPAIAEQIGLSASATNAESMGYWMRIKFTGTIEELVGGFEKWARREARENHTRRSGKASAPPYHKLKWLAALRLNASGLKFGRAMSLIDRTIPELSDADKLVWP